MARLLEKVLLVRSQCPVETSFDYHTFRREIVTAFSKPEIGRSRYTFDAGVYFGSRFCLLGWATCLSLLAQFLTPHLILSRSLDPFLMLTNNVLPIVHVVKYLDVLNANVAAGCQNTHERIVCNTVLVCGIALLSTVPELLVRRLAHLVVIFFEDDLRYQETHLAKLVDHLFAELLSQTLLWLPQELVRLLLPLLCRVRPESLTPVGCAD